jgi:hypothetical protein
MTSHVQCRDIYAGLIRSLHLLNENVNAPISFLEWFERAETASELYDTALKLSNVANSRDIRWSADAPAHRLLDDISKQIATIDANSRLKLTPNSPQQKREWKRSLLPVRDRKYVFRDDGSLEVSVLDSMLRRSTLHVGSIWSPGFRVQCPGLKIKLDQTQAGDVRRKFAELCSVSIHFPDGAPNPEVAPRCSSQP